MKEFDPQLPSSEKTQIINQKQFEKKGLFTSTARYRGHTMYEFNCTTGELKEAEFKAEKIVIVPQRDIIYGGVVRMVEKVVRDVDCKENCLYLAALNKKNAKEKFAKYIAQNVQLK